MRKSDSSDLRISATQLGLLYSSRTENANGQIDGFQGCARFFFLTSCFALKGNRHRKACAEHVEKWPAVFAIHHFHCPISDVVHLLYTQHLVLSLELFGDALSGSHLLYHLKEHSLRLLVQIGKINDLIYN